jgi:nitrogen regulatory protein P-II 2
MKLIIAYVQPAQFAAVKKELFLRSVTKMSVINAVGCGQQMGYTETYRGTIKEINLRNKIRLEIAVNDNFVDTTIEGIIKAARTGKIGDGKIFVMELAECIRIRTGDKGSDAIG